VQQLILLRGNEISTPFVKTETNSRSQTLGIYYNYNIIVNYDSIATTRLEILLLILLHTITLIPSFTLNYKDEWWIQKLHDG